VLYQDLGFRDAPEGFTDFIYEPTSVQRQGNQVPTQRYMLVSREILKERIRAQLRSGHHARFERLAYVHLAEWRKQTWFEDQAAEIFDKEHNQERADGHPVDRAALEDCLPESATGAQVITPHHLYMQVQPPAKRLHEYLPDLQCEVTRGIDGDTAPGADTAAEEDLSIPMYCAANLASALSNPVLMRNLGNWPISYQDGNHSYTSNSAVVNYKTTADKGDVTFMDRTRKEVYHAQVELLCHGRHKGDAWGDAAVNHSLRNALSPDFAWPLATICNHGDGKAATDRLLAPVVPMMAPLREQGGLEITSFISLPPILFNEDGTVDPGNWLDFGKGPLDFDSRLTVVTRTPFTAHGIISMDMKANNVFWRTHYARGVKSSGWHNTLHEDQV
jgi:hypothetical protein